MRIAVISDLHGDEGAAARLDERTDADRAFILGDGCDPIIERLAGRMPVTAVAGNCDGFSRYPAFAVEEVCGVRFFLTHGHLYPASDGYAALSRAAKSRGCTFALAGHTHIAYTGERNGVTIFTPGSPSHPRLKNPSFGLLEWRDGKFFPKILDIRPENC